MCFEYKIESLAYSMFFFSKQFNLMTRKCKCRILYKAYYVLKSNDEYYYYHYYRNQARNNSLLYFTIETKQEITHYYTLL